MPFTPSHVAAVLPLRRLGGRAFPLAALAAGSMSPDLPYYLPVLGGLNRGTHTAVGVLTVDLPMGLAMWALWRGVGAGLHDLAPRAVRERWEPPGWASFPWWTVVVAVAAGAATHVAWDEFTHAGRWGPTHFPVLAATIAGPLGPLPGYRYAQYASGALGLAVVAVAALRRPRVPRPATRGTSAPVVWLATLLAGAAGAVIRIDQAGGFRIPWDSMAFAGLTGGMAAAGTTVLVAGAGRSLAAHVVGWTGAGGGATGDERECDGGR